MEEIKPNLSPCTFIFDHIFYCTFFIILVLVGIDKKENPFRNNLEWFHSFDMKMYKKSQNLLKVWPKIVLFRNIVLIFNLEKPWYLENRVVREPCKRRSACTMDLSISRQMFVHCYSSYPVPNQVIYCAVASSPSTRILGILEIHYIKLSCPLMFWKNWKILAHVTAEVYMITPRDHGSSAGGFLWVHFPA